MPTRCQKFSTAAVHPNRISTDNIPHFFRALCEKLIYSYIVIPLSYGRPLLVLSLSDVRIVYSQFHSIFTVMEQFESGADLSCFVPFHVVLFTVYPLPNACRLFSCTTRVTSLLLYCILSTFNVPGVLYLFRSCETTEMLWKE